MKDFVRKTIKKWLGDVPPFPDEDDMEEMIDMGEFCIREWCMLLVPKARILEISKDIHISLTEEQWKKIVWDDGDRILQPMYTDAKVRSLIQASNHAVITLDRIENQTKLIDITIEHLKQALEDM